MITTIVAAVLAAALTAVAAALFVRMRAAHRRAEASAANYRRGARWLRRLVDANPLPLVVIGPESNVRLWNRAAEELFGWPEREVLGLPVPTITTDKLEEWRRLRELMVAGNTVCRLETTQRSRDGRVLDVALSAVPIGREIVLVFDAVPSSAEPQIVQILGLAPSGRAP